MKLVRLCLFVLTFLSLGAQAANIDPRIFKNDVCGFHAVVHINGVDTDRAGAERNLQTLAAAYGNSHNEYRVRYGLAYNRTLSLGDDVVAAMNQTLAQFPGITYADWVRAFYEGFFPSYFPTTLMATISTRLAQIYNINRPDYSWDPDLNPIMFDIQSAGFTTVSAKLLIVGHSQGSIYANVVYRKLTAAPYNMLPRQLGLMSIAAFVQRVEGSGSTWVTNANDRPVTVGRFAYPSILGHTVTIPHTEDYYNPWRGHNLVNKYLAYGTSKSQIVQRMAGVMSGLQFGYSGTFPVYMGIPPYGMHSVKWVPERLASPSWPYMPAQMSWVQPAAGVWQQLTALGTKEQARLKTIDNTLRGCVPLLIAVERKRRLGIAWSPQDAWGCITSQQYAMVQAWNIYSANGEPQAQAQWDSYTTSWIGEAAYTCRGENGPDTGG